MKVWQSIESIFGEIEHEFNKLFGSEAINTHRAVPCVLPLSKIHYNRPGRSAFLIPKDVLDELREHSWSWKKISHVPSFEMDRWNFQFLRTQILF